MLEPPDQGNTTLTVAAQGSTQHATTATQSIRWIPLDPLPMMPLYPPS